MAVRPRFDPNRDFVAARGFTFANKAHAAGDPFDKAASDPTRLKMLYESRAINFAPEDQTAADPVVITKQSAGYYSISAPWLDEPIRARGKVKADETADQVREDGPPLGWIEGGTDVTVTGGDGGWYEVYAPWLDEPEKVQGRKAAEARQNEIHAGGEPDAYKGVTLIAGENGWYDVVPEWADGEKVQGQEAARLRAAELREEGPPPADDDATDEIGEVPFPGSAVIVSQENDAVWMVTAPWLDEPHRFKSAEEAGTFQATLREEGPPEGWEPDADEAEANDDTDPE